jgi:hypothetical protein
MILVLTVMGHARENRASLILPFVQSRSKGLCFFSGFFIAPGSFFGASSLVGLAKETAPSGVFRLCLD